MKKHFSTFILIMIVLSVVSFSHANAGTKINSGSPLRQQRGGAGIRFALRQIREANRKLRYTIKARYPQALGAGRDPRLTKLNQELRKFIIDLLRDKAA
ncbi:MAG: hypothetical protein QOH25_1163 [Acidobacteriota bacterium]|jgi:hypothetical protein|nr:hypothetical protein [Acidobacteriota bacterium]